MVRIRTPSEVRAGDANALPVSLGAPDPPRRGAQPLWVRGLPSAFPFSQHSDDHTRLNKRMGAFNDEVAIAIAQMYFSPHVPAYPLAGFIALAARKGDGGPNMPTPLIPDMAVFQRKLATLPLTTYQAGETVLSATSTTGRLLILKQGAVAVVKEGVEIARVTEPGSVFGELSVL